MRNQIQVTALLLTALFISGSNVRSQSPSQPEPLEVEAEEFSLPVKEQRKLRVEAPTVASANDLIPAFRTLARQNIIQLRPLSSEERRVIAEPEGPQELAETIGIDRELPTAISLRGTGDAAIGSAVAGGLVSRAPAGGLAWTIAIASPGASAVRVEFEPGQLSAGSRLYVTDGSEVYGPYTLSSQPTYSNTVFNSRIYIQLQVPAGAALDGLTIRRIAHLVLPPENVATPGGPPESLALLSHCKLRRFCRPTNPIPNPTTEQAAFETATLGVARIFYKKGTKHYVCSGGLLADRTNSRTPFFLTARHCFSTQASATSLETFFRYRKPCNGSIPGLSQVPRTKGATLLATSSQTDFTLVQLSQSPPTDSHFFRWSTADISDSTTALYRVHHPHGWTMHSQNSTARRVGGCSVLPRGRFIYSTPTGGGTAGGSSGSLVFRLTNGQPEVVGQLYGACSSRAGCGYANVDGAFARTYPNVQQYLDR